MVNLPLLTHFVGKSKAEMLTGYRDSVTRTEAEESALESRKLRRFVVFTLDVPTNFQRSFFPGENAETRVITV